MDNLHEQTKDQQRWNEYGLTQIERLHREPERFIIHESPFSHRPAHQDLTQALQPLEGTNILEMGAGRGEFSVFLAKQGAKVTGIDIGSNLIESARILAQINNVDCRFEAADVKKLPFNDAQFDVVVGVAILHHLSGPDLIETLQETHRVLNVRGKAVFYEPVENSRTFDFIQSMIPVGQKGTPRYRPSILQRKAWANYMAELDDRTLTNAELMTAGNQFQIRIRPYGLLTRLQRIVGNRYSDLFIRLDRLLLKFPLLQKFSRSVLVEYSKT